MEKIEKKVAEKYNANHPQGQQQQQQPPPPPPAQPQQQQAPPPAKQEHHGGANIAKKAGNAVIFGAGATAGADAINGLIN